MSIASAFLPGENIHFSPILSKQLDIKRFQLGKELPVFFQVQVPARVGFCVRDMTTFGRLPDYKGKVGGGGLGMAVDVFTTTNVAVLGKGGEGDLFHNCKREAVARHHVAVFRKCLENIGIQDRYTFVIEHLNESFDVHCGLGSTSSMAFGIYLGLNLCFGEPFANDELRELLACNYVEEALDNTNKVTFGYETTMTATGAIGGGAFLIDPHTLGITARNTVAFEGLSVALISPATVAADADEVQTLTEGAVSDALSDEQSKKQTLFDDVLQPQLQSGSECDLAAVGEAVFSLNLTGGKRVEIQKKGQRILKLIETIRRDCAKVVIAGMSSIGPTVAAVCSKGWCSDDSQQLREVAQLHGFAVRETAVNITGFKSTERSPKFVLVLGLPCAGKTTICRSVAESSDVDAVHFPAGKVIRDFINESPDSPESRELKQIVTTGEVEDRSGVATRRLLRSLVPAVMAKSANSELPVICLLDGFPRSEKQLTSFLDDLQFKLAALVVVSATDQVRRDRAQSRAARGVEEPPLDVRDGRDETEAMVAAAGMRAVAIHHVTNYEGMCEVIAGL